MVASQVNAGKISCGMQMEVMKSWMAAHKRV